MVRRSKNTTERSVEMVERKMVDVASFATHIFPLERADEAFRLCNEQDRWRFACGNPRQQWVISIYGE